MIVIENVMHNGTPVSMTVEGEGVHGFLFENRETKTRWMDWLSGCDTPDEGQVLLERKGSTRPVAEQKKFIGYVPASLSLYEDMTVLETLDFFGEAKGISTEKREKQIKEAMDLMGLQGVANRLVGTLSAANCRRTVMAQAVLGNPAVIVMDEPLAEADAEQTRDLEALLEMLGRHKPIIIGDVCADRLSLCRDIVVITENGASLAEDAVKTEEDEA